MNIKYCVEYDSLKLQDIANRHKKEIYENKILFKDRVKFLHTNLNIINIRIYKIKITEYMEVFSFIEGEGS